MIHMKNKASAWSAAKQVSLRLCVDCTYVLFTETMLTLGFQYKSELITEMLDHIKSDKNT